VWLLSLSFVGLGAGSRREGASALCDFDGRPHTPLEMHGKGERVRERRWVRVMPLL